MIEKNTFLRYTAPDYAVRVNGYVQNGTAWSSQIALVEMLGGKATVIKKHRKNIFDPGDLVEEQLFPFWK